MIRRALAVLLSTLTLLSSVPGVAHARLVGSSDLRTTPDAWSVYGGNCVSGGVVTGCEVNVDFSGNFLPSSNNAQTNGTSSFRWSDVETVAINLTGAALQIGSGANTANTITGNVTVGTNGSNVFDINAGTITINQGSTAALQIGTVSSLSSNDMYLDFDTLNRRLGMFTRTPASRVDINGNLTLGSYAGTTAAPTNGLIVSGNASVGTSANVSTLDVNGGISAGTYAGVTASPSNGMIISGSTSIGTSANVSKLDVNGSVSIGSYAGVSAAPSNGMLVSGNVAVGTVSLLTNAIFQVGSANNAVTVKNSFWIETKSVAPAISSCGTNPSVASGNDQAGDVTIGSSGVTTCTITFANAPTNIPSCFAANNTIQQAVIAQPTATTLVIVGTASGAQIGSTNNVIRWGCNAWR